ncbi:MAG: hypothetical protein JW807_06635 [Spirochaetes bacterium]|nr:hypothetical protein [Spirochaetota bacterium]
MRTSDRNSSGLRVIPSRHPLILAAASIAFIFCISPQLLAADTDRLSGTIAIFSFPQAGIQFTALSQKAADTIADTFDRLGRFMPVEAGRIQRALADVPEKPDEASLLKAAERLNADLFAMVVLSQLGNSIVGTITIVPISERYKNLRQTFSVRSLVLMNVPLKLAREVALLHRKLPVEADILERRSDGTFLLGAGQWQGLRPGKYRTTSGEAVIIRNTSRLHSIVELPPVLSRAGQISIREFPAVRGILREIDDRIEYNTNYKYSLANAGTQGVDPEKKFMGGICLINPGANFCIPGYGSFLSTAYLGFRNTSPSIPGVVFSSLLLVTHFILPEAMTKFKINFFPGVMDDDKTADMNNLQIFLWSTVPLTVSVAFLDQLAHQFTINSVLPPFFMTKNEAALVLSMVIPGGGMFYKGHRIPGWGFYLSDMFLAGFCVYTKDDKKKVMWGGIALGGVKLVELLSSFFSPPSFKFYNKEKEGRIRPASLSFQVHPDGSGEPVYGLGMSFSFQ